MTGAGLLCVWRRLTRAGGGFQSVLVVLGEGCADAGADLINHGSHGPDAESGDGPAD